MELFETLQRQLLHYHARDCEQKDDVDEGAEIEADDGAERAAVARHDGFRARAEARFSERFWRRVARGDGAGLAGLFLEERAYSALLHQHTQARMVIS